MSLDLSTLKVGDHLRFGGNDGKPDDLWVDAISDLGVEMGGIYVRSPRGFFGIITTESKHLYEVIPPAPPCPITEPIRLGYASGATVNSGQNDYLPRLRDVVLHPKGTSTPDHDQWGYYTWGDG